MIQLPLFETVKYYGKLQTYYFHYIDYYGGLLPKEAYYSSDLGNTNSFETLERLVNGDSR